jgi:hypothetical protein
MGFYTRFKDPAARTEIARYYRFIEQHDAIFRGARPLAESLLIYPRTSIHEGKMDALLNFKDLGRSLLDAHRLFAILPDDVAVPEHLKPAKTITNAKAEEKSWSRFDAPKTVRVSASVPADGGKLHFHFVNYNRIEPEKPKSPGRGIADEKPIATDAFACDVALPAEFKNARVFVLTPESSAAVPIASKLENGRLKFTIPSFLIYALAEIQPGTE